MVRPVSAAAFARSMVRDSSGAFDLVLINDSLMPPPLGHLLKYDSVPGRFPGTVEVKENALVIDGGRRSRSRRTRTPPRSPGSNIRWISSSRRAVTSQAQDAAKHLSGARAGDHLRAGQVHPT